MAQARKEKEVAAFAGFAGQLAQIRFEHTRRALDPGCSLPREREAAQHFLQRAGEFADRYGLASEFVFEVVEDRLGGMGEKLLVEQLRRAAGRFDGNHLGGKGNAFATGPFEEQIIRGAGAHGLASNFFTSFPKSVASWKRPLTLPKDPQAPSSM